jgi:hypothetical protein
MLSVFMSFDMLYLPSTNSIKSSLFTRHKELEKEKEKPRNKVTS